MSMYRREWNCCDSVTETSAWEPEKCPFCEPSIAAPVASIPASNELVAASGSSLPMDANSRHARLGEHIFEFAAQSGWKDDGEGAFEFIQRQSYAVGIEDAGGTPPSGPRFGNRWPISVLEQDAAIAAASRPNAALVEALRETLTEAEGWYHEARGGDVTAFEWHIKARAALSAAGAGEE